MKIRSIHLYRVRIPFRKPFRHATHERNETDNLLIETTLTDGSRGYGEGLPRSYVTGETPESVLEALQSLPGDLWTGDLPGPTELLAFLEGEILSRKNFPLDRENNTARAALELSLIDAYLRSFQKTPRDLAHLVLSHSELPPETPWIFYDGVLSLGGTVSTAISALKLKCFGFKRIKIKADGDGKKFLQKLGQIRRIVGRKVDLRIDANEAWDLERCLRLLPELEKFAITALEQPLPHAQLPQMKELKSLSPIPLMLDESLCSLEDAHVALREGYGDLFNIRLSKCGGFVNSLKIARLARRHGWGYQLGCMVGETAVLSAAGRHWAAAIGGYRYLEGSYDKFLLKDNIAQSDLSFGYGGKAPTLKGAGWGIEIDRKKLMRYAVFQKILFEARH